MGKGNNGTRSAIRRAELPHAVSAGSGYVQQQLVFVDAPKGKQAANEDAAIEKIGIRQRETQLEWEEAIFGMPCFFD